uniref:ATP-dependent DNA helicase n=1 Tax=Mesocestoides corti TaxID=53468 RepID=A0A5K3EPN6_MESCO
KILLCGDVIDLFNTISCVSKLCINPSAGNGNAAQITIRVNAMQLIFIERQRHSSYHRKGGITILSLKKTWLKIHRGLISITATDFRIHNDANNKVRLGSILHKHPKAFDREPTQLR